MIGLLIQLLLSYFIVRWVLKENLSFMGWRPQWQRLTDFFIFLLLAGVCSAAHFLLRMYFAQEKWVMNPSCNASLLAKGSWYQLKSVLYEELIFRGALFYLLIKKLGSKKALLLSAVAFGIYHWFSYELFNQVGKMAVIFLITGAAGLLYGYAYLKTRSLYVPIALHFGWNFVNAFVFSNSNKGPGLLIEKLPPPQVQVSWLVYAVVSFLPLILFVGLNLVFLWRLKREL